MKTNLNIIISTIEEAKLFFDELVKNNEDYHPEDDAHEIVFIGTDGKRCFTDEEAIKLNLLMDSVFEIEGFDPCEYMYEITTL